MATQKQKGNKPQTSRQRKMVNTIAGSIQSGQDYLMNLPEPEGYRTVFEKNAAALNVQPGATDEVVPVLVSADDLRGKTASLLSSLHSLLCEANELEKEELVFGPAKPGIQGCLLDTHEHLRRAGYYLNEIRNYLVPVLLLAIVFAPSLRGQTPRSPEVIQAEIRQHVAQAQAVAGTMAQLQEFQAYIHEQQVVQQLQQELAAAQQAKPAAKPEAPKKEK